MSERAVARGTLLVLAASRYQLEVIEKAKELGYRVITTDNVPDNPGHRVADESFGVDTTDAPKVIEIARAAKVSGVVAPCTDVAVVTAARVGEALGLRSVPVASAETLTSKVLFRVFLRDAGLPAPSFEVLDEGSAIPAFRGAKIVKPEGSSGSKGIFVVNSGEELRQRLPASRAFSPSRRVVLEDVIPGRQGTCEGVVINGEVVLAVVTDRETAPLPYVATAGHYVPSRVADADRSRVLARIAEVLDAQQITTALFDCDFVLGDDGAVYLLEIAPRLGGNSLTRLVRAAVGVDLAELAVRLACGEPVPALRACVSCATAERAVAQLVLGVPHAGRLAFDAAELEALRAEPWVVDLSLDYAAGVPVEAFVNGRTRVGEATVLADTRDQLDARVRELRRRLALHAVP